MEWLIFCIVLTATLVVAGTFLLANVIKTQKARRITVFVLSVATVLCHYSSIIYHAIGHAINPDQIGTVVSFLKSNPNLVIPMYPCNMSMWCCLILGIMAICKKDDNKVFRAIADFCFLFGTIGGIGGLFANGDYFVTWLPKNYDVLKSAVAHGFLLLNCLSLPFLGYFKLDCIWNSVRNTIMVAIMGVVGLLCSVAIYYYGGKDLVVSWNAMFLYRSPFDGFNFVRFYTIMPLYLVLMFGILAICEVVKYPKELRFKKKYF